MSELWKVFSKAELQELIGQKTLDRLTHLLPAIAPGTEPDSLYYKDTLAQIFDAFAGPDAIAEKFFRAQFLNHLPPARIDGLLKATDTNGEGLTFEQKVSKLASRSWKDGAFPRAFLDALRLPSSFLPAIEPDASQNQVLDAPASPLKTLKDYQFGVHLKALQRLSAPNARFIVQMPTGSGKTRTAMEVVSAAFNESAPGSVVVWLAHSEELCEQAYEGFREIWQHLGHHPLRILRLWGAGRTLPHDFEERAFVIGGFQKMHSILSVNPIPFQELSRRAKLIVVDEAHKVLAPTYKSVTKALIGEDTAVIGLTATPGRSAIDADQNMALAEFFFSEIVTIDSGAESVIQYLRNRKVLSEVSYSPLYTRLNYEMSATDKAHLEQFFDLPAGILKRIGSDDVRNIEILKRLQYESADKRQIIFFACSIEHSKFITAMLLFLGITAAHIDGTTSRMRRRTIIEDFRKGSIQIICNFGVLSTGFDAPKTDLVFIARPTASIVLYSQMVGRGLRGPAIGGTESCKVIDVKDNIVGFSNEDAVYSYFEDYFHAPS